MSIDNFAGLETPNASQSVLSGGGEMGVLMRSIDWAATALGPLESWSESLRSALSLCLNAQFPMAIYWGDALTLLYNDAWRPIAGDKHPGSMGRPAIEVWAEIWDAIDPLFQKVYQTGEGTFSKDQLLLMHRHGYTEECYFDFTFSPIKDLNGSIGGILNVVQETTYRVINERRARLLREVASLASPRTSVEEVCQLAIEAIATDPQDIPFALFYLLNTQDERADLVGATGLPTGTLASPLQVGLAADTAVWPIAEVVQSGRARTVTGFSERLDAHFMDGLSAIPQEVMVLPVIATGQGNVIGVLVAGVSPRRVLDEQYRDFYERVVGHLGAAIANAKILEEERKRAEALAEIDRVKTAFFSNVSHELRTPLTLILGPIEDALEDADMSLEIRLRLNMAHRNVLRLQKLVNTLLDFSRIEAAKLQVSYQPTDLAAYTAELASMFQSTIEKAGLCLEVNCPPLSEPVYIDRELWEKIVINLLSNAFKHTFSGKISVSVQQAHQAVQLVVQDTGVGIPAHELSHLFDRFHRVPNTRSRTYEGSGIGLALVQELVKLHGGTISVASVVEQGTTFTVSIPAGKAHLPPERIGGLTTFEPLPMVTPLFVDEALRWLPESEGALLGAAEAQAESWRGVTPQTKMRARIILAEDNADMRHYVCSLLAPHCEVEAVVDGAKALAAARRELPDLVLSDVMMPEMDGFELLKALRADSNLRNVSIILLSARAGEEARLEGLQAGADDYLTKPFSARELLARVKVNLDLHRVRCESIERNKLAVSIIDSIRAELDLDSILSKTVTQLGQLIQADRCAIWLYNLQDKQFEAPRFEYCSSDAVLPISQAPDPMTPALPLSNSDFEVVQYVDVLQVEGLTEQDRQRIKERGIKSLLHVPILYQNQLLGTLRVHTVFEHRQWDNETVSLLYYMGAQVAIAIYHAQLIAQVKDAEVRKSAILESLQSSESRLRAIMEATSDCIKIVAEDGTLLYINQSGLSMLETTQAEWVMGCAHVLDFIAPECAEQWITNHNRVCRGESLDWEFEMLGAQGTRRWVETHAVPLPGSDGSFSQLAVTRDVTERRRRKAELQRAFQRERLIRRIVEFTNHTFDINNLLNIVAAEIGKFFMADRCFIVRFTEENSCLNVSISGRYHRSPEVPVVDMSDFPPEIFRSLTHNLPIKSAMRFQKCNTQAEYIESLKIPLDDLDYLSEAEKAKYYECFRDILAYKYGIHAILRTGIQYRNIAFGTIALHQCHVSRAWTDEEVDLLQDIATQIGVAFYQTELYHQEQEAAARELIVRKFIQTVHSAANLEDKFHDLCNELGQYLEADHVFIARYDERLKMLLPPTREYRSSDNVPSLLNHDLEAISEKSGWMFKELSSSNRPFYFDLETPGLSVETKEYLQHQNVQSGLGIAIQFDETCLAILFIHQSSGKRVWTDEEKVIIEAVARQAAIATYQADLLQNEQKARKEAEEANLKKSEFLAMMSHELRTPLNAILGYSRMIENGMGGPLTEQQTKYISGVCLSGAHLLNLVNDLLDVAKAEAGKMSISPGLIEIAPIVAEVQSMMGELAAKKDVNIQVQVDSNVNRAEVDPARFKQILINLVTNAIKFNHPKGSVYVHLYRAEETDWLIGEVRDTGIGIPEDQQAELFKKFYQADNTASRAQEGTGLGLALTKELVALHGGDIWVESRVGEGSTFRFKLPLRQHVLSL